MVIINFLIEKLRKYLLKKMVIIKEIKSKSKKCPSSHQSIKKNLGSKNVSLYVPSYLLELGCTFIKKRRPLMRKRKYVNGKPTNEFVTESEEDDDLSIYEYKCERLYDIDCLEESKDNLKIIITKEKHLKNYSKGYL